MPLVTLLPPLVQPSPAPLPLLLPLPGLDAVVVEAVWPPADREVRPAGQAAQLQEQLP